MLEVLTRQLNFRRAGEELGVTHAAVSMAVSRLEDRFGVPLFVRGSGAMAPTAACIELVEAYKNATAILNRAVEEATRPISDRVTVSLPSCAVAAWLCGAMGRLQEHVPGIVVRVHPETDGLDFNHLDAAVIVGARPPEGFDGEPLFDEQVFAVCTPDYAARHAVSTPAALASLPLLIHSRQAWRAWLTHAGLFSEPVLRGVEVGDAGLGMQAALAGQAAFLACTVIAASAITEGRLVAPIEVSLSTGRRMWVIWRRSPPAANAVWRFVDWIHGELRAATPHHTPPMLPGPQSADGGSATGLSRAG